MPEESVNDEDLFVLPSYAILTLSGKIDVSLTAVLCLEAYRLYHIKRILQYSTDASVRWSLATDVLFYQDDRGEGTHALHCS